MWRSVRLARSSALRTASSQLCGEAPILIPVVHAKAVDGINAVTVSA